MPITSCSSPTKYRRGSGAPGRCSPSSITASNPTSWSRRKASPTDSPWAPSPPATRSRRLSGPATTCPRSAATRFAAPPRWRISPTSSAKTSAPKPTPMANTFWRGSGALQAHCPLIGEVRGLGLMIGLELIADAGLTPAPPQAEAARAGLLAAGRAGGRGRGLRQRGPHPAAAGHHPPAAGPGAGRGRECALGDSGGGADSPQIEKIAKEGNSHDRNPPFWPHRAI